jgi:hypothetical protein
MQQARGLSLRAEGEASHEGLNTSVCIYCLLVLDVYPIQFNLLFIIYLHCVHSVVCSRIYIFRIKTVKHNKCIFDVMFYQNLLFRYVFRSDRTIIRQSNIGIRLVIEITSVDPC